MSSDNKELALVLEAQQKRDLSPNISSQVISELKGSLIFQYNWQDLLQPAPTAINSLGSCFVASSSPKAAIQLVAPGGRPFKYLRYETLQANLVELGNLGRMSFIEAESGMGQIQQTSAVINGKLNDVVQILSDPPSAKKLLRPQLGTIQHGATACYDAAVRMDKKFEQWLLYACELHAAAVNQSGSTKDQLLSNQLCLAAEQTRLDYNVQAVDSAKASTDLFAKQVTVASESFKKASNEFPTGWDIMGQQIVGDLTGCVTSAFSAAIPALVNNMNPMAKVSAGTELVGDFIKPRDNGTTAAPAADAQSLTTAPISPLPKQAADPAYTAILKDITYLTAVNSIVLDKDGNVNWEQAKAGGGEDSGKSSISFLIKMLEDAQSSFAKVATDADPSATLKTVLTTSLDIARAISTVVKGTSSQYPAKDSDQVKKWQADFQTQYTNAVALASTARSMPGNATGGVPMMSATDPVQTAQIDAKTMQAQATLGAAKDRLNTTQAALSAAKDNYLKASDALIEQQGKLGDVQANLARLTASSLTLEEIKKILIECIKLVITLKQSIINLVRFFKGLAAIVEVCVNLQVTPFLDTIKALMAADGDDPNKNFVIGGFTLTDLQRTQIYSAILVLKAYFSVFGEIAKMWCQLSIDSIMPGVKLCDDLSVTAGERDTGAVQKRVKSLQDWSAHASGNIAKIAGNKKQEIIDGMQQRIDELAETTKLLPSSPSSAKAITDGTNVTKDAAQNAIAQKAKAAPLNRFTTTDG